MYPVKTLPASRLEETVDLFVDCFVDDLYFTVAFPDEKERARNIRGPLKGLFEVFLDGGTTYGIDQDGTLAAFLVYVDYFGLKKNDPKTFSNLFESDSPRTERYLNKLQKKTQKIGKDVLFLLYVGVKTPLRGRGLASELVNFFVEEHPSYHLVSDVSNVKTLSMYRRRGFRITKLEDGAYFVHKGPTKKF